MNARARRSRARHPLDYDYWARQPFWEPEEAAALSLGGDPDLLNSHTAPIFNETTQFERQLTLITRAVVKSELQKHFKPAEFARWADGLLLPFPQGLRTAIDALPPQDNEKEKLLRKIAELERQLEQQTIAAANAELHPRERVSLQILVATMASSKYGFDLKLSRNPATQLIVDDANRRGLNIDPATVLKHLRQAFHDVEPKLSDR